MLKRRKRSRSFQDDEKKSKGVKVYEYYESKRTKSKKPKNHGMTTTVYTSQTVDDDENVPKHRERLTFRRLPPPPPPPHSFEASEVEDLADDQYFYDQLEKTRPLTESSIEVEHVYNERPHVNREVAFHGSGMRRGKHRQKSANIRGHADVALEDVDVYGDYGEMVMPDRDVEMHETFEKNTHESHVHQPSQYPYDNRMKSRKRYRSNSNPLKHNAKLSQSHRTRKKQVFIVHKPTNDKKFEKIMVTKKINTADQLHDEIDKIFETKNKYYDKRGHDKAHWELRIVPQRYEEPEGLTQL